MPWSNPEKMRDDLVSLVREADTQMELARLKQDNAKSIDKLKLGLPPAAETVLRAFAEREAELRE